MNFLKILVILMSIQSNLFCIDDRNYDIAEETWGNYLNVNGEIPKNKFKAIFIDTLNPKKIITTAITTYAGINSSWKKSHKDAPSHFAAYWVGDFTFENDGEYYYSAYSEGSVRIIIDNKIIYKGNKDRNNFYFFKKGNHKIEIEFISNWTREFHFFLRKEEKIYSFRKTSELQESISSIINKNTKVYFVGALESDNEDLSIEIDIKTKSPIILFLSSGRSVRWKITNKDNAKIQAVVYNYNSEILGNKLDMANRTFPCNEIEWADSKGMFESFFKNNIKTITGREVDKIFVDSKMKKVNIE